jgi:hypothetical protein
MKNDGRGGVETLLHNVRDTILGGTDSEYQDKINQDAPFAKCIVSHTVINGNGHAAISLLLLLPRGEASTINRLPTKAPWHAQIRVRVPLSSVSPGRILAYSMR